MLTSFYPMYDFAKKVGGDKIQLYNMVPAGTEPHDWEPATGDIVNLEQGDIFIYSGGGMEHWVDQVLSSLSNKNLVVVEASKGLEIINVDGDHADSHVWLSIPNAITQMESIKNSLVAADSKNTAYYEENFAKYSKEFQDLHKEYKTDLGSLKNKTIVVAHEAFGYLCNEYGLEQMAIEGLTPDSEPDPARMSEIITFAKENGVNTIFFEELASPKVAEVIAKEIGAETAVLNPLEGLTQEQIEKGEELPVDNGRESGGVEKSASLEPIISIEDLSFSYGKNHILKSLYFSVNRQDFIGITGSNGAGKSTLIKVILGQLEKESGNVKIMGQNIESFKEWWEIGYVPQMGTDTNRDFPATSEEIVMLNLYYNIGFLKRPKKEHKEMALEALKKVGMEDFSKHQLKNLSGGQYQRVMIAKALVSSPKILILDEPMSGVDTKSKGALYKLLAEINSEGITILFITHDVEDSAKYLNRVVRVENHGIEAFDLEGA